MKELPKGPRHAVGISLTTAAKDKSGPNLALIDRKATILRDENSDHLALNFGASTSPYAAQSPENPPDTPYLSVRDERAGAPLLIIFSAVNASGFSFYTAFDDIHATKVYVRDPQDSWYNNGLDTVYPDIASIAERLRWEIARLKPSRVVTFGTSMGGYAALLFGAMLDVSHIVAVSAQTLLDPRLPHTPKERFDGPYFDLVSFLTDNPCNARIHLFFGAADMVDCYNALRLMRLNSRRISVIPIKEADHLVAAKLAKSGALKAAVVAALNKEPFSHKADLDKRVIDPVVTALIIRTIDSHYLDDAHNVGRYARALSIIVPGWSAPHFLLAHIADAKGASAGAVEQARLACVAAPGSVTYADFYADMLRKWGSRDDAIAAYRATLAIRPKHYNALCNLALLHAANGNRSDALQLIDQAIETRPRLEKAGIIKNRIITGDADISQQSDVIIDKNQL